MLLWFMSCLLCLANVMGHAQCHIEREAIELPQKFYVQMDQIEISENKIYIHIDGIVYSTPALFSDENGIFVDSLKRGRCAWYEWECPRRTCQACNLRIYPRCPHCNWPDPENEK
jgi:hypothetical protein